MGWRSAYMREFVLTQGTLFIRRLCNKKMSNISKDPCNRRWFWGVTLSVCLIFFGYLTVRMDGWNDSIKTTATKAKTSQRNLTSDSDLKARTSRGNTDVIHTYLERAKRGMSDLEILGVIDDYASLGHFPTSGNLQECRAYAIRLDQWFAEAVTDALLLTSEQRLQLRHALAEYLVLRMHSFQKTTESGRNTGIFTEMHFEGTHVYRSAALAPWNLCTLTEEQTKLTTKRMWENSQEKAMKVPGVASNQIPWLMYGSLLMQDPSNGLPMEYPPPSVLDDICKMHGTIKGGLIDITTAFPLTPDQAIEKHRMNLLAQVRMLHPSQLRMALLINPAISIAIRQQLEGQ